MYQLRCLEFRIKFKKTRYFLFELIQNCIYIAKNTIDFYKKFKKFIKEAC